jgi:hypothetical protein
MTKLGRTRLRVAAAASVGAFLLGMAGPAVAADHYYFQGTLQQNFIKDAGVVTHIGGETSVGGGIFWAHNKAWNVSESVALARALLVLKNPATTRNSCKWTWEQYDSGSIGMTCIWRN